MAGAPIEAEALVAAPPERVFEFLSRLENHWRLLDGSIEVLSLEGSSGTPGAPADRAVVRMRGPLGIGRTARTRVLEVQASRAISGSAEVDPGTRGRVRWELEPNGDGTAVHLRATVERAGALDRALLALGGRVWLRRRLANALARLGALL